MSEAAGHPKSTTLTAIDYAPFVGCEMIHTKDNVQMTLEGVDVPLNKLIAERIDYDPSDVKLVLRSLGSMTDEEDNHLMGIEADTEVFQETNCYAKEVTYLIRKGFDVFGWIPAGLAIKKA